MQLILSNCENLVNWELELEKRFQGNAYLLEEQKKNLRQLIYQQKEDRFSEWEEKLKEHERVQQEQLQQREIVIKQSLDLRFAKLEGKLEGQLKTISEKPTYSFISNNQQVSIGDTYQQNNNHYQQLIAETEKQIQSLNIDNLTVQDKLVINQTIIFWGAQELFLDYRQKLLAQLIAGYCQVAKKTKTSKLTTFTNLMGISNKLVGAVPGGNVAQTPLSIISETINLAFTIVQQKTLTNYRQKLQEILTKDKAVLILFDSYYHPLEKSVWNNHHSSITTQIINTLGLKKEQFSPFSKEQDPYKGIWKDKLSSFSLEELETFLKNLESDLETFQQNFHQQRSELSKQEWFKTIEQKTDLFQKQQLQSQSEIPTKNA